MKIAISSCLVLALVSAASAYQPQQPQPQPSRRVLFQQVASAAFVGMATVTTQQPANAIDACPKGSSNCIRTTWTPPAGTSKSDAAKAMKSILESYPQEGQSKVDLGGYSFAEDALASSGTARVEYQSGIGNFAKFFNGGKPFVDDLIVEVGDGAVEIKSASRIGDSDLGVNEKRLKFLGQIAKDKGWTVPDPKY